MTFSCLCVRVLCILRQLTLCEMNYKYFFPFCLSFFFFGGQFFPRQCYHCFLVIKHSHLFPYGTQIPPSACFSLCRNVTGTAAPPCGLSPPVRLSCTFSITTMPSADTCTDTLSSEDKRTQPNGEPIQTMHSCFCLLIFFVRAVRATLLVLRGHAWGHFWDHMWC